MELYRKHRPKLFKSVLGQDDAIAVLDKMVRKGNVPHALLLQGPSGTGKTTVARILKEKLECGDQDFAEINAADTRGIDTIRDIRSTMNLAPMDGKTRIWLIDEAHKLSNDAQNAILKMLEEPPSHVYFMLATTDSQKLIPTIRNRCQPVSLKLLPDKAISQVIASVLEKEEAKISSSVLNTIIEVVEGSARKALVLLEQVLALDDEEQQLAVVQKSDTKRQAFDLVKALSNSQTKWREIAKIIEGLGEDDWEGIRRLILKCASGSVLKGKYAARGYLILCAFESHWYDCGKAGLVRACYEVCSNRDVK